MAALFQLSYSPVEIEVVSKGNTRSLIVSTRCEAQVHDTPASEYRRRQQKAAIELRGPHRQPVDLVRGVGAADVARCREVASAGVDDEHVSVRTEMAMLDLDPQQATPDVEDLVRTGMAAQRPIDSDPPLEGFRLDDRLSGNTLLVVCQLDHEHMFAVGRDGTTVRAHVSRT
ncbi:MAG TPA: hypothetical protein VFN48_06820 [Solirubrobacteraceae bacterium]|nr:hypothetical protein [Solirubrobacteraceae bacterium]